jgi:two-component system sensor histidine kinase YesM
MPVFVSRQGALLYFYSAFEQEPWTLINVIPVNELYTVREQLMPYGLTFALIAALLIIYLSDFFANRMLQPIYTIRQDIKEIEIGNVGEGLRHFTIDDDLGHISDDIYNLIYNANSLLNEVYTEQMKVGELETRKNEAELISLQNQINPHFLYNTFSTVKFLVDLGEYNKAKEIVTSLGKLFRQGVYRGQIIVSVREEVEHAEAYVSIQKMRYEEGLRVDWYTDEEIFRYRTLKFVLQPLIENAIQYGVESESQQNTIAICGYIRDHSLIFEVIDNGVGIEKEKKEVLLQQIEGTVESERVGLKNINERIRLYCGEGYGIHIESEYGVYTRIIVKIKLME